MIIKLHISLFALSSTYEIKFSIRRISLLAMILSGPLFSQYKVGICEIVGEYQIWRKTYDSDTNTPIG